MLPVSRNANIIMLWHSRVLYTSRYRIFFIFFEDMARVQHSGSTAIYAMESFRALGDKGASVSSVRHAGGSLCLSHAIYQSHIGGALGRMAVWVDRKTVFVMLHDALVMRIS